MLLVHAEDAIRVTFQVVLKREGYGVLEASSAAEALEQLGEVEPDLLITDIRLPRKSGLELIRTIRSQDRYKSVRILALSSKPGGTAVAIPAGVEGYQPEPVTPEQLVRLVTRIIGRA